MAKRITTRDALAAEFNVHLRTIAAWIAAGAPGKSAAGCYSVAAIQKWRVRYAKERERRRVFGQ
jgi:hypothetical protein